jgi:hypothetical protein
MTTRTTGAEYKRFMADDTWWPAGAYHEDESIDVDGIALDGDTNVLDLSDTAEIVIDGGIVFDANGSDLAGFEAFFRKWKRAQSTVTMTVEVPRDKVDAVKRAIIKAGGKIL